MFETGQTPDELEFLWCNALLDMAPGRAPNEQESRRQIGFRDFFTKRVDQLADVIGQNRARNLFDTYRNRLQEFVDAYDAIERSAQA